MSTRHASYVVTAAPFPVAPTPPAEETDMPTPTAPNSYPNEYADTMTQALFGIHARRAPAWMYVQNAGPGLVSFIGASRVDTAAHPLRYGSTRTHQLIVSELIVRPHIVIASDVLRGSGLPGLMNRHDEMLRHGEVVLNPTGRDPRQLWWTGDDR